KQIYLTPNNPETKASLKKDIENQLKNRRIKEKISEGDIEWILKDNQRQCYYILFMIIFCDDINTLIHQAYNYHEYIIEGKIINKKCSKECALMFYHFKPTIIHNLETLYDHIILYFISLDRNKAITQLDFLKSAWSNALKNNNHNWIDKSNQDQVDWIIEYYRKNKIELWFINNEDLDSKYHTCISILDLWQENEHISKIGSKDYFIEKMKRSWSQQKYRLNVKNKKSINFRVEKETEKKLNKLCSDLKLTKSQLIELAIEQINKSKH
ncbi:CopG family transcriptional regulator, partial [Vibrio cholerae]